MGRDFGQNEREVWVSQEILEATLDACIGRADVSLSFDDGNWSDIEVALPALARRSLNAALLYPGVAMLEYSTN